MSNAVGASNQPCMILDDDELERGGGAVPVGPTREWRRSAEDLATTIRAFRGEPAPASPPLLTIRFPTAFQTYTKPERGPPAVRGFPFQQQAPPRRPAAAAPSEHSSPEAPPGSLFKAVRRIFYNSEKGETPPQAATSPPQAPPPLSLNPESVEEESYPYAQCTPPAKEAPPPGYSPKTPPWWPEPTSAAPPS